MSMNKLGYVILAIVMIIAILPIGLAKTDYLGAVNRTVVLTIPNQTACEGTFSGASPCSSGYDSVWSTHADPNNIGTFTYIPMNWTLGNHSIIRDINITTKKDVAAGCLLFLEQIYNYTSKAFETLNVTETGGTPQTSTISLLSNLSSYLKQDTIEIRPRGQKDACGTVGYYDTNISYNDYRYEIEVNLSSNVTSTSLISGENATFTLQINSSQPIDSKTATFYLNGTSYAYDSVVNSTYQINFTKEIDMPTVSITRNLPYNWTYTLNNYSNYSDTFNITVNSLGVGFDNACSAGLSTVFNFTFYDEQTDNPLKENVSFNVLYGISNITQFSTYGSLSDIGSFVLCMNSTLVSNYTIGYGEIVYSATDYYERKYYMFETVATNTTVNVSLYSLLQSQATAFYYETWLGTSYLTNAFVVINKKNPATGTYFNIGVRKTDDKGEFVEYLELNKEYEYIITGSDGTVYTPIYKTSVCSAAPCEVTLQVVPGGVDIYEGYYDTYGSNVVSSLNFNKATNITTYTFFDSTGLANHFRLIVTKAMTNNSDGILCDNVSYAVSGTLTCDMTGQYGDFRAVSYVSRSPEVIDEIIGFIIELTTEGLGQMGLILSMAIIITVIFAAATISRGNPSVIIYTFAISMIALKLMTIFPFSWLVVTLICLLCYWILDRVNT